MQAFLPRFTDGEGLLSNQISTGYMRGLRQLTFARWMPLQMKRLACGLELYDPVAHAAVVAMMNDGDAGGQDLAPEQHAEIAPF